MEVKHTGLKDILKVNEGEIVALPPFNGEVEFNPLMKQPSLSGLISSGEIPNELIGIAHALFVGDGKKIEKAYSNEKEMKKMYDLFHIFAQHSLVSPTYQELSDAGIELTDMQLVAIMNYTLRGVKVLSLFRGE